MGRKAKTDYENELQIQKDEEFELKQSNQWFIRHNDEGTVAQIALFISSGRAWKIMLDMQKEVNFFSTKHDCDVYVLTRDEAFDFMSRFYGVEIDKKVIKTVPKVRKQRIDKGKTQQRKAYVLSDEERQKRSERAKTLAEKRKQKVK